MHQDLLQESLQNWLSSAQAIRHESQMTHLTVFEKDDLIVCVIFEGPCSDAPIFSPLSTVSEF